MSLESASFIKALVASNPEGTDPKSLGDDHVRMIKAVLQSQFAGFTDGLPITLTETNLNRLGGVGSDDAVANIDTVIPYTCFIGVTGAGTLPPGGAVKDMILNVAFDASTVYQTYWCRANKRTYRRQYEAPGWSPWTNFTPLGVGQVWTQLAASRLFNTFYVNTTGQTIQVSVAASSAALGPAYMEGSVSGVYVARVQLAEYTTGWTNFQNSLSFTVPPDATYSVTCSSSAALTYWAELR